jgi:protein-tyrosine phosphatase
VGATQGAAIHAVRRETAPATDCRVAVRLRLSCETPRITPMTSDNRVRSGTILAVCTGNLCRSPVVERLLRLGLTREWPAALAALPIASAGTGAAIGQPIPLSFATRLASVGAETTPFAPRQVTARMVAGAELVITATRAHRATVVQLHPRAVQYTFTLRELARLAAALPAGGQAPIEPLARLRTFVAATASLRGADVPGDPTADDVRDPYGGNDARYAQVWSDLVDATSEILGVLCPAGSTILTAASARST